ncbi:MAG TPA: radical SAM protein [bacterium]|nr:radical SAM protein [bacterium]HPJ71077.1 radical SAM protein [bacterium]HPQ65187.1 radical SAM protein [bacterium]
MQRQKFALPGVASMAAAAIKAGYGADILIENAEPAFEKKLAEIAPGVVGVTLTSSDVAWLNDVLPRIRRTCPGSFIIAGGIHPTIHPALLEEYPVLDAICRGEGEEAMVELLEAREENRPPTGIGNLVVRFRGEVYRNPLRPLIVDLDAFPEDRGVYFRRYPDLASDSLLQYITSRGCPYPCSFCVNHELNRIFRGLGPVQRRKSVDFALRELQELRRQYRRAETVFFIDDLFLQDREWIKRFLPRYRREIGLPFICSAGPRTIDGEIADLLASSGCASVEFGIETGNESKRRELFNKKAFTDAEFRRQIGLVKERGIEVYAPSMFCFPTETPADSFRTVEFYHELGVDHPFSSFLFPYPHTRIHEIAIREGCIAPDLQAEDLPSNYFTKSICRIPRRRVIENIQYLFYFFAKHPRFYRYFKWLVYLPVPLKPFRYLGLFFWFKNWKRMGYMETIRYFWRFRKAA